VFEKRCNPVTKFSFLVVLYIKNGVQSSANFCNTTSVRVCGRRGGGTYIVVVWLSPWTDCVIYFI
jgi:hypothetical protein